MANRYEIILEAEDKATKNLRKIERELGKVDSTSRKAAKALSNIGKGVGGAGLKVATSGMKGLAVATAAASAAFVTFGVKSLNALDDLEKASKKLGISTKFLSSYGAVASRAGIDQATFTTGLQRFTRRLGEAQMGVGELLKPLERMGINMRDSSGNFREGTDVFEEFIDKLGKTANAQEALALATKGFDTEGVQFINIAKMGADEIDRLRKNALEAGIVVDQELAQAAADAKDSLNDLTDVGKGFGLQFFGNLAGPLEEFTNNLKNKIMQAVKDSGGMKQLSLDLSTKFLDGISNFVRTMGSMFDAFANSLRTTSNILKQILVSLSSLIPGEFRLGDPVSTEGLQAEVDKLSGAWMEAEAKISAYQTKYDQLDRNMFGFKIDPDDLEGQLVKMRAASSEISRQLNEARNALEDVSGVTYLQLNTSEITSGREKAEQLAGAIDRAKDSMVQLNTATAGNGPGAGAIGSGGISETVDTEVNNLIKLQNAHREYAMTRIEGDRMVAEEQSRITGIIGANTDRLFQSQEQANIQAKAYQTIVDEINSVLSSSVSLTADQRYQLEAVRASYYEAGRGLVYFGENAELVKRTTTDVAGALQKNRDEYALLSNLLEQYTAKLKLTGQDTDANKAIVNSLTLELNRNEEAYRSLTGAVEAAAPALSSFQTFYNNLLETSRLSATEQTNMALSVQKLRADLDAGRISLDAYAIAMGKVTENTSTANTSVEKTAMQLATERLENMRETERQNPIILQQLQQKYNLTQKEAEALGLVNRATEARLTTSQQIAKALGEENAQFKNLNDTLGDTTAIQTLADKYGVAADDIVKALKKARNGMDRFKEENVSVTGIISGTWQEMSKTMASSITQGIMSGKGTFNSFGDFLESFADRVISQILEKMLIQPMIDQMSNFASGLFGGGGMGGGMGGGGGILGALGGLFGGGGGMGFGGMLSGLWGGVSSFFSGIFGGLFADGGYLPAGKVGIAGEAGPELITGPARITSNEDSFGGGGPNITFNINSVTTQDGVEFILKNKQAITGVVNDAYNRRGQQGIY